MGTVSLPTGDWLKSHGKIRKAKDIRYVGEEAVSEAEVTFMLVDRNG